MRIFGLTGGIGSGKSTVARMLAARGWNIIDADAITKELQSPGQPTLATIVDTFGHQVLTENGELDRQALADIVFRSHEALSELNAIVHPAVGLEITRRLAHPVDGITILDVPLLIESGRNDLEAIIVVDLAPEIAIKRLVEQRNFTEADARGRIANQIGRTARLAKADHVLDNSGTLHDLERQVFALARDLDPFNG